MLRLVIVFSSCLKNSGDRKSTRLNSSHANISYAVFCLKKKTNFQELRCLPLPSSPNRFLKSSHSFASFFFFFNDTGTTEIYTLSLHDALPIRSSGGRQHLHRRRVEMGALRDERLVHAE